MNTTIKRGASPLDLVQRRTLRYFWEFAHPDSYLARERSNVTPDYGLETVCSGGSGFGIMAILCGVARGWLTRDTAIHRIRHMVNFLRCAERYHGAMPHFLDGSTGKTFPLLDDGGDIVETSYLIMGLLCARQFFNEVRELERALRSEIQQLWNEVEWSWYAPEKNVLMWHWSPNHHFGMNVPIRGWNECLITYVIATASPTHPIKPIAYHEGWAKGASFHNGKKFYGIKLPLGPDIGGPLFFSHYSFLGLDPRGLSDKYTNYWKQNRAHVLVNRAHSVSNPHGHEGYTADCWGLTSSDGPHGYTAHSPTSDFGVITPSAALSSFPYAPRHCMKALKRFLIEPGLGDLGFPDAFCPNGWVAESCLAIDQGPIIVMIENYRSGLLWKLFMSCPEIKHALRVLGFRSPILSL